MPLFDEDYYRRLDLLREEQASTGYGVFPSASEFIRNSGYDPTAAAFANSEMFQHGTFLGRPLEELPSDIAGGLAGIGGKLFGKLFENYDDLTDVTIDSSGGQGADPPSTMIGYGGSDPSPKTLDYINADLAKYYGMSKETAYQEALANTSYQREMADMKAAGLNPSVLYGAGRGSGAGGVSYVSGSGGGRSGSGGKAQDDKLFSNGFYHLVSAIAGVSTALALKNPNGYWIGSQVAQGLMSGADAIW